MDHAALAEQLFQDNLRFETLIHLGAIGDPEEVSVYSGPCDHFWDALANGLPATLQADFAFLPPIDEDSDDQEAFEGFLFAIRDKRMFGFVAEVSHPVMDFWPDGEGATFSWGKRYTAWFYGETLEEIATKAQAWAAGVDAKRKAKAAGNTEAKA